ncbi:MAG: hypothetical protein IE913_02060 [Halothiobacillus sp.]|nr:hypothetical protein [Halothiobacillus sp.]
MEAEPLGNALTLDAVDDAAKRAEDMQVARNNYDRYLRARDNGHLNYVELAKKCEDFYVGEQWSEETRRVLDEEKRPALTINMVQPIVNAVLGAYVNRRQNVRFIPAGEGDDGVANALTKLYMQACNDNMYDRRERMVFEDGLIMERGFFEVRMDFDENLRGDVRIKTLDPLSVLIDPDAKEYDPDEWKEVFISRWMSVDDIEDLYGGDKAKEVAALAYNATATYGHDSVTFTSSKTYGDTEGSTTVYATGAVDGENKSVRKVRVIERQYRKMRRMQYFVDMATGDTSVIPDNMDAERIEVMRQQFGLQVIERTESQIRWTITADSVLLHDDWSPYSTFTVVPFFPYFRRGRPFGLIRNLIDPQEQFNKISSQALHIVNTTANSGWIMEEGSLVNMTAAELRTHGAKTGLVMEVAHGRQAPQKIQPNQIPTGVRDLAQMALSSLRQISGVSEYMLGEGSPEVSGVVLEGRISQNLAQLQVVFDNLDYTRHLLAKRVLALFQQYYTEARVVRVTTSNSPNVPPEMLQLNMTTANGVINDLSIGKYDVVVDTVPTRETFEETQFAEVVQLRNAGVLIPDDAVIEHSHLENKYEIAERVRAMMGQGQPSPEEQQMMQAQQQITLERMMLELEELRAEIAKLESETMRNVAKAQADSLSPAFALKQQRMKSETELTNKTNELMAKLKVAQMQAEAGRLRQPQGQIGRYNQQQSLKAGENGL